MSWRASKAPLCEVDTDMCRSPHLERINRLMNRLFRPQWCNQDDPTFSHWTLSWHKEAHYCSVQTDPSEPCLDGHLQEGSVWMWATLYYYLEFCDVLSDQLHKLKKQRQKKKDSFTWRYEFQPLFKCPAVTWWCLVFGKECHHQPGSLWDSFGRWTFWRVVDV